MRDGPAQVKRIGCAGHTHALRLNDRLQRWRCTDRNCPDVRKAHSEGLWAFHVYDWATGETWTEFEDARVRRADSPSHMGREGVSPL